MPNNPEKHTISSINFDLYPTLNYFQKFPEIIPTRNPLNLTISTTKDDYIISNIAIKFSEPLEYDENLHKNKNENLLKNSSENRIFKISKKLNDEIPTNETGNSLIAFQKAGPSSNLFFDPLNTTVAILTTGGICPGLNTVISSIITTCNSYNVKNIIGIKNGFYGFHTDLLFKNNSTEYFCNLKEIDPYKISKLGGSILVSDRGGLEIEKTLNFLDISVL